MNVDDGEIERTGGGGFYPYLYLQVYCFYHRISLDLNKPHLPKDKHIVNHRKISSV